MRVGQGWGSVTGEQWGGSDRLLAWAMPKAHSDVSWPARVLSEAGEGTGTGSQSPWGVMGYQNHWPRLATAPGSRWMFGLAQW